MSGGSIWDDGSCGDGLLAIAQSPSLSGFQGCFEEYVPVFLDGKKYHPAAPTQRRFRGGGMSPRSLL